MNKVLRNLDEFLDESGLSSEVFTENNDLLEVPKHLKPTSVLTIKKDETPILLFACDREKFWVNFLDSKGNTETIMIKGRLEKSLKSKGLVQVR